MPKLQMEVGAQGARGLQPQSHPKALEHPTGLPKPATQPRAPVPAPTKAPVTLKPDGSVEENFNKKINPQVE